MCTFSGGKKYQNARLGAVSDARARQYGNRVAPAVVLTGNRKGGQALARLAFCASISNKLFPIT